MNSKINVVVSLWSYFKIPGILFLAVERLGFLQKKKKKNEEELEERKEKKEKKEKKTCIYNMSKKKGILL